EALCLLFNAGIGVCAPSMNAAPTVPPLTSTNPGSTGLRNRPPARLSPLAPRATPDKPLSAAPVRGERRATLVACFRPALPPGPATSDCIPPLPAATYRRYRTQ